MIDREPAQTVAGERTLLVAQGVAPWTELPLWLPASDRFAGFMSVSVARAAALGLPARSLDDIVRGVLAEPLPNPATRRPGKLSREA